MTSTTKMQSKCVICSCKTSGTGQRGPSTVLETIARGVPVRSLRKATEPEVKLLQSFCNIIGIPLSIVDTFLKNYDWTKENPYCVNCRNLVNEVVNHEKEKSQIEEKVLKIQLSLCSELRKLSTAVSNLDKSKNHLKMHVELEGIANFCGNQDEHENTLCSKTAADQLRESFESVLRKNHLDKPKPSKDINQLSKKKKLVKNYPQGFVVVSTKLVDQNKTLVSDNSIVEVKEEAPDNLDLDSFTVNDDYNKFLDENPVTYSTETFKKQTEGFIIGEDVKAEHLIPETSYFEGTSDNSPSSPDDPSFILPGEFHNEDFVAPKRRKMTPKSKSVKPKLSKKLKNEAQEYISGNNYDSNGEKLYPPEVEGTEKRPKRKCITKTLNEDKDIDASDESDCEIMSEYSFEWEDHTELISTEGSDEDDVIPEGECLPKKKPKGNMGKPKKGFEKKSRKDPKEVEKFLSFKLDKSKWLGEIEKNADGKNVYKGIEVIIGDKSKIYKCGLCGHAEYPSLKNTITGELCVSRRLRQHICEKHLNGYSCIKCPHKIYPSYKLLISHVRHHEYTPIQCEICEKPFNSRRWSKEVKEYHLWSHKGEEEKAEEIAKGYIPPKKRKKYENKYVCTQCGISTTSLKTLEKHEETHLDPSEREKTKVPCTECGKLYYPSQLHVHEKGVHRKKERTMYGCKLCPKSYYTTHTLNIHIKSKHTGERDHSCDICNKKFLVKHTLTEHLKIHASSEKPYPCPMCNARFTTKKSMQRHIKSHHTGDRNGERKKRTVRPKELNQPESSGNNDSSSMESQPPQRSSEVKTNDQSRPQNFQINQHQQQFNQPMYIPDLNLQNFQSARPGPSQYSTPYQYNMFQP